MYLVLRAAWCMQRNVYIYSVLYLYRSHVYELRQRFGAWSGLVVEACWYGRRCRGVEACSYGRRPLRNATCCKRCAISVGPRQAWRLRPVGMADAASGLRPVGMADARSAIYICICSCIYIYIYIYLSLIHI